MRTRVLIVSSYPPRHCGIGAYAHAQAEALRAEGAEAVVISPPDGEGDHRVSFDGGVQFAEARRLGEGFDRIVVHFQPGLYYRPRAPFTKITTSAMLLHLVRNRPQTEIMVHEADPPSSLLRPDYFLLRRVFARATLLFHTEAERRALERSYRVRTRARLVRHEDGVAVGAPPSREAARRRLGVGPSERLLLCAGFLHPGKGYERAVEAFGRAGGGGRLVVLGSVRDATPSNEAYAASLRELCSRTPGATLVEDYVSDDDFDAWIVAADRLVLPYRVSWSSGALARAHRLGTPVLVADVGGLAEQAGPDDDVFRTDEQLVALVREALGEAAATEASG